MRGHRAIAMDLPCDHPESTFDDYSTAVVDALAGVTDVVLVGHLLGAVTPPYVARRIDVRLLIFLCGVIPATPRTRGRPDEPRASLTRIVTWQLLIGRVSFHVFDSPRPRGAGREPRVTWSNARLTISERIPPISERTEYRSREFQGCSQNSLTCRIAPP
jgi:hypothetical protein